jgi:hypothetical protein
MSVYSPFQPTRGKNQKVTAGAASATVAFGKGQKSLRVLNAGAVVVYFRTFDSADAIDAAKACTNTECPVGPAGAASSTLVIEKPEHHDSVAYLADSSTSIVHFQPGEGGA